MHPLFWTFTILGGYLIGSISPSYFLGKILKKIDIRDYGQRRADTFNTYKVLGLGPAIPTAIFDLSKGVLVLTLANLAGASPFLMYLTALAAILGQIFPFYLRFRGGQGIVTASGILVYYLVLIYMKGWLPWESLFLLVFCLFSFIHITKTGEFVGAVVLSFLAAFVIVFSPFQTYTLFILSIIIFILFITFLNIRRQKLLNPKKPLKEKLNWRLYLRPVAVLFIINYLKTNKKDTLTLIGSVVLFFLLLDFIRLFSKKINIYIFKNIKDFYKSKEYKTFSSITIFLVASFLTILLFEKSIAILAVSYLIFGDFFSKFFGLLFGQTRIFKKSLQGSLAHFNACLLTGFIILHFVELSVHAYLTGAFVASLMEVLPLGVNDNFSVPLLSASTMYVFLLF